jgi:pimeloyl-ACP methyl ester carboxylesterase
VSKSGQLNLHDLLPNMPPLLAVWGRNDPFFLAAGAEAYKRDIASAEVQFYNAGHFALETHAPEIGFAISQFLERVIPSHS